MQAVRLLPCEQDLGCRTGEHRKAGTYRDRVAQTHGALGGRHTDALVALMAEELGAFVGVVAQGAQDRTGGGEEAVLAGGCRQLTETGAQHETALHVA